ncbi:type II secretion system F family protein [Pseudarthrobacter sp. J75]|uniref:type II secretion system F family protein n=1 Tax=unclassified Pseudarthrobacter TaxID=2647000 RepID=UPI002E80578B|nr:MULTISPECIES: type II secretion system F family protein [unclassified Pseudarthrobacter]MEE2521186.1 type II secretion system F family protein [Pseudarthrobacter sp. J47]MEE2528416.1 type II secretion system F family protein [Pseudarthrobacter sp. J75]
MQPLAYAAVLAIVVPISAMVWLGLSGDRAGFRRIQANLGNKASAAEKATSRGEQFAHLSGRLTPKGYVAWLDKQLAGAGRPRQWPLQKVIMAKPLLGFAGSVLAFLVYMAAPSGGRLLLCLGLALLSYFLPDLLIRNRAQKRREAIRLELPNALDQMLISVQAGLGFEAAMSRVGEFNGGPLADELIRTLQDIQVGRSRKDAYLALAQRVDVPDVRTFVRAVVQADIYGIAIANVLKTQAKDMRIKRKQRAEEHAMKMPVKMLFPLIFFILPTLFIVLLGPTVLNIIDTFERMNR